MDPKLFWSLVGARATGATVVTAEDGRGPAGFLGLSATHVSADPPTVLVSIDARTSALSTVLAAGHFAINFLSAGQGALADLFGGKAGPSGAAGPTGADRFEPGRWTRLTTGAPVLVGATGAIDCRLEEVIERGGTRLVLGRVVDGTTDAEAEPLILFRGRPR